MSDLTGVVSSRPMKHLAILVFLAAAAVLWASNNPPPMPEGYAVNRFQLASGPHPGLNHLDSQPTLYRIDSATGKVWALQSAPVRTEDGKQIQFALWQEVQEPGGSWSQAAAQSMVPVTTR